MSAATADPALARRFGAYIEPLLGLAIILLGWEVTARILAGTFILASPLEVAQYLAQNRGLMWRALTETLGNAALGFLWGNLAAMALATVAILWPVTQRTLSGLALLVFCLPLVATGPILRVLFGPGDGPQITLAAMAVYYTTYVPLLVGLRAAPASWFELIRSYGRGRGSELVHVRAMAALPYLFAGLQIAAPAAFLGAMVGEFTGAERGMGVLTIRAMRALDVPATWALACTAAAVSIAAYAAIGALARALTKAPPPVILASPDTSGQRRNRQIMNVFFTMVLALGLWWGAMAAFDLTPFFAKRPWDVVEALLLAPDAAETRTTLLVALGETVALVVPGYLAGLALGAGLATLLTLMPAAAAVAMPLAVSLRSVPIVTTAPLAVLLLGRGPAGTITLVGLMVFFPTFVACLHGLRQAPGQILDVLRSYAAGPVARLVHVRLPAMLPAFFAAARMGVPASVLAVTVVEWLGTGEGVGALMALSASLSDYDMLWSSIVVVALLSVLGYAAVAWAEARILSRYAAEQVAR